MKPEPWGVVPCLLLPAIGAVPLLQKLANIDLSIGSPSGDTETDSSQLFKSYTNIPERENQRPQDEI
jgi:hypothetical protein